MRLEYKDYVRNVVKSYLGRLNKKAIFIKHYNTINITLDEMLQEEEYEHLFLFHEFEINSMKEAFEPFLGWIKICYEKFYKDKFSPEEFVEQCGVYVLHRQVIYDYIKIGKCNRHEEVLMSEYNYEQEKMLESIYTVFRYVAKEHSIIMIMSKLHMVPYSTLRMIHYIIDRVDDIYFIFTYNDIFFIRESLKENWNILIERGENENMILEWGKVENQQSVELEDRVVFDDMSKIKDIIIKVWNMYYTFAMEDADYYLEAICDNINKSDSKVLDEDKMEILIVYALVNVGLHNSSKVLFICENMCSLLQKESNPYNEYMYNYISAMGHLLLIDSELADKYCRRCREIAEELDDDFLDFKIDVMKYMADFGSFGETFKCEKFFTVAPDLIERTLKYHYNNFLTYLYVYGYENDVESISAIAKGQKEPYYFNKGIELAKEMGNTNLLLVAYMKNIIVYSSYGYHKYVRKMYEKRIEVSDPNNLLRRAHMYAGVGYNSVVMEEYADADQYFRNGLELCVKLEKADDISEVLYNMALNYFVAGIYDRCVEYMEYVIKIMNAIDVQEIRICNVSKLYGIVALAHYKLREYYNCYYYLDKIELVLSHILNVSESKNYNLWEEDLYLYHMLRAVMYAYEGSYDIAQREFDKAYYYLNIQPGTQYYTYSEYIISKAEVYENGGESEKAKRLLEEGIQYCIEKGYYYKQSQLEAMYHDTPFKLNRKYADIPVDFAHIMRIANFSGTVAKLKNRDSDVNFLTICQDVLIREQTEKEVVIENCMNVIQNNFNLEQMVLLDRYNECKISYAYMDKALYNEDIDDIFRFFDGYRREFIANRIEKNYKKYIDITDKFGTDKIVTIVGIPIIRNDEVVKIFLGATNMHRNFTGDRKFLNPSKLQVMKVVVEQLDEAIRRVDNACMIKMMNSKLEKTSITDQLTGIYNRMGFEQVVSRLSGKSGNVFYLDLDNFKYYNDNFGHEVGDVILVEFARMLKEVAGDKGNAIRYGGDEFILFMPDISREESVYIAREILDRMSNQIRQSVHDGITGNPIIERDKVITCSIGISTCENVTTESMDEALKQADKALYFVKSRKKGDYAIWPGMEK